MSDRRTDIEGLRAIAILLVIAYHARVPFVPGGYVGVDVFFALSGYLITGLLVRELRAVGRVDLVGFYARRARRLLPAAALVLVATMVSSWFLLGPLDQQSFTGTALASALYLNNVWFGLNAADYLAAPPDANPFLHLWSLAVEEQFYLAWPLILWGTWYVARRRAVKVLVVLCALSFASSVALQSYGLAHWAFFGSPARAWEFGAGALGALRTWALPARAGWLGLALILVSAVAYGPLTTFPGIGALPPVLGTVLMLVVPTATIRKWLAVRPMQWLGLQSYSWYLWHWPVLVVARTLSPDLGVLGGLGCSLLALGLSALTFRIVEDPLRHLRPLVTRPWLSIASSVLLTAAVLTVCLFWRGSVRTALGDPRQSRFVQARQEMPDIYRAGCHLGVEEWQIRDCVYGDPASDTTVLLWGDSHAAQWFPAFERTARKSGWRLLSMTKSGCPPADISAPEPCETWRKAVIARIRETRPDLVVLANAAVYVDGRDARLLRVDPEEFEAASRRTLAALAPIPTAVILPVSGPHFDVPMCLARAQWHGWPSGVCNFTPAPASTRHAEIAATSGLSHVTLVDLDSSVCRFNPCPVEIDGTIVFRDDNHIAPRLAARLASDVAIAIEPLLNVSRSGSGAYSAPRSSR